jgi:cysteine desulfurase
MEAENVRILALRDRLWNGIKGIEEVYLNGSLEHRVAHNLNLSFGFVDGESLLMAFKDMAVSSGSACTSASLEPSHVLTALGLSDDLAHSSIRFSFGRFTSEQEIDHVIDVIQKAIMKLREISPLWHSFKTGTDAEALK